MKQDVNIEATEPAAAEQAGCCGGGCCGGGASGVSFEVSGMTCGHCVESVTRELRALDGVEEVTVQLVPGGPSRVSVVSSAPLSDEQIDAAVEEAGYDVIR